MSPFQGEDNLTCKRQALKSIEKDGAHIIEGIGIVVLKLGIKERKN